MDERPHLPVQIPSASALPAEWPVVREVLDQIAQAMPSCALFVVDQELRFRFAGGRALESRASTTRRF
jgi:hypothetical protein